MDARKFADHREASHGVRVVGRAVGLNYEK
jgi:hypothetical protein